MTFAWRPMAASDVDGVVAVARASFPEHFEERVTFEERLALFPAGCFVLASGDTVKGYLIAYPWTFGSAPPLNSLIGALPPTRELIYLHDLALHPDMRGTGQTGAIVERLAVDARTWGAHRIALVSVNRSQSYWERMGFRQVIGTATAGGLASYGDGSVYMIREL